MLAAVGWWVHATAEIQHAVNDFRRTGPFGGSVSLEPGVHTLWIEGDCLSCAGNEPAEYREAATVAVVGPRGMPLDLRPAPDRLYNTGGNEGRALWVFDTETGGEHRVTLSFDTTGGWDNRLPSRTAIGAGAGLPVRVVRPMAAMGLAGAALGVVSAVAVRWRRQRWFRAAAGPCGHARRRDRPHSPGGAGGVC